MASIELRNISKQFGTTPVIHDLSLEIDAGEFTVFPRSVGLRKVDAAAHDRRPRRGDLGRRSDIDGQPCRPGGARRARHRHGVPVLRALSAHDGARQPGLRPRNIAAAARTRSRRVVRGRAQMLEIEPLLAAPAEPALGRPAPARRHRPRHREGARAFLFDEPLSNLDAALRVAHPRRARAAAPAPRLHDGLRHPRPGRGDDAGRPHRGAERTAASSRSARRSSIYRRPANRFVAGFIGSPAMNFLQVEPAGVQDGAVAVRLPDGTVIETDVPDAALAAAPRRAGRSRRACRDRAGRPGASTSWSGWATAPWSIRAARRRGDRLRGRGRQRARRRARPSRWPSGSGSSISSTPPARPTIARAGRGRHDRRRRRARREKQRSALARPVGVVGRRTLLNALFVLPYLVVFLVLMIVPLGVGLWLSFQDYDMLGG